MSRQMKDSGIEWIGEIPADWTLGRIGQLYSERREKVSDTEYAPLSVTMQGIVPQLSTAAKTDAHDDRKLVKKGDFAINSRSDRRGSCGVSPIDGSVSLINTILCPHDDMNAGYYNWLFHTSMFADEYYKWGHGIVNDLWTTGWQEMKRISIPVPAIEEQAVISNYLEQQCAHIDAVIEKTKASIEEYKKLKQAVITQAVTKGIRGDRPMKASGIEWIGEIPADWSIQRFKNLGKCWNGLTYSPDDMCDEGNGTLVLRSSNIQNGKLVFDDNVYVNCDVPAKVKVHYQDILICSRNGSAKLIGKNAIIGENVDAAFGAFMMVYRSVAPRYLRYILNSDVFMYNLSSFLTSTVNQLTAGVFNNIKFPYTADVEEQEEIVRYLDDKCSSIDKLIDKKEQILIEMESYKKSLIYEYVTGKKEVPQSCR